MAKVEYAPIILLTNRKKDLILYNIETKVIEPLKIKQDASIVFLDKETAIIPSSGREGSDSKVVDIYSGAEIKIEGDLFIIDYLPKPDTFQTISDDELPLRYYNNNYQYSKIKYLMAANVGSTVIDTYKVNSDFTLTKLDFEIHDSLTGTTFTIGEKYIVNLEGDITHVWDIETKQKVSFKMKGSLPKPFPCGGIFTITDTGITTWRSGVMKEYKIDLCSKRFTIVANGDEFYIFYLHGRRYSRYYDSSTAKYYGIDYYDDKIQINSFEEGFDTDIGYTIANKLLYLGDSKILIVIEEDREDKIFIVDFKKDTSVLIDECIIDNTYSLNVTLLSRDVTIINGNIVDLKTSNLVKKPKNYTIDTINPFVPYRSAKEIKRISKVVRRSVPMVSFNIKNLISKFI